jgi:hypothetical protein
MLSKLQFIYSTTSYNFTAINIGYSVVNVTHKLPTSRSAGGTHFSSVISNKDFGGHKQLFSFIIEGITKAEVDAFKAFYDRVEGSKEFEVNVVNEVETKYNISAAIFSGPVKYQQTDELY